MVSKKESRPESPSGSMLAGGGSGLGFCPKALFAASWRRRRLAQTHVFEQALLLLQVPTWETRQHPCPGRAGGGGHRRLNKRSKKEKAGNWSLKV